MSRWAVVIGLAIAAAQGQGQQYFDYSGGSGVIGYAKTFDFNAVNERAVPVTAPRYEIRGLSFTNCTNVDNLAVIRGGVYTETGGAGTKIGNFDTGCVVDSTNPPNHPEFIHNCAVGQGPEGQGIARTAPTLYVRVTTPRGAAMTCDFHVVADTLP